MLNQTRSEATRPPTSILAYDIETIAPEQEGGGFPPWPLHKPVALGLARAEHRAGEWRFDISALVLNNEVDEAALVREADRQMASVDRVCTYNGAQFDSLCLRLAAQRSREWGLKALARHAAAPRFGGEHADLADLYASFGRKVSLASICNEVGIPVKTSTSGADVAALWAAGETETVRLYVCEDAVATLTLYLAWSAARAADEAMITRPLAALARHIEGTPELDHLEPFVSCALTRWAHPRALRADVAAALARMQQRFEREETERRFVRA